MSVMEAAVIVIRIYMLYYKYIYMIYDIYTTQNVSKLSSYQNREVGIGQKEHRIYPTEKWLYKPDM